MNIVQVLHNHPILMFCLVISVITRLMSVKIKLWVFLILLLHIMNNLAVILLYVKKDTF